MARKKITIERTPIKPAKKKRNLSEAHKEKLRQRLAEMRAKKKPAEYKNVSKIVLALPDEDTYSFKNVKEWIKESKLQSNARTIFETFLYSAGFFFALISARRCRNFSLCASERLRFFFAGLIGVLSIVIFFLAMISLYNK
jgi:hypothetical protein